MFPTKIWNEIQLFVLIISIPYFTGSYKQPNKAVFLNLGTTDIFIILCCGRRRVVLCFTG